MEPLVADELLHGLEVLRRGAAGHQLVEDGVEFLLGKGAAFEQDFAHRQHLAFGQAGFLRLQQAVDVGFAVVDNVS